MWLPSFHLHLAAQALNQGKVIAYPTESVYGLGCDPNNLQAIERLLQIKSRCQSKGLILIAGDIRQLEPWVDFAQIADLNQLLNSWPGHETWLVPMPKDVSPLLSGQHDTLAVRVTAHPIVRKLCQHFNGAITSTSANRNGQKEATSLFSTRKYFGSKVDYYLPGDVTGNLRPSRIRDGVSGQLIRS